MADNDANEKILIGLALAFVIDVLLNLFWPITILTNTLFEAVYKVALELAPQYIFYFYLMMAILAISEYLIIFAAVLTFGQDPIKSIKDILGIE